MKHTNTTRFLQATCLAALTTAALLAPAHAALTPNSAGSAVATGPLGTIAYDVTNTDEASDANHGYYSYGFMAHTVLQPIGGAGSDTFLSTTTSAASGALATQINQTFGAIDTGHTLTSGVVTVPLIEDLSITTGTGRLYSDLSNLAQTGITFTFKGNSSAAGNGVVATLSAQNSANGQSFSQQATWNQQGDWSLQLATPLGFKFDFFQLGISGKGLNTLSSVSIAPTAAVPEASTVAMMGLGLVGLVGLRRSSRH